MNIEWDKIVESEKIYEFPKNLKENLALFSNWMSFMTTSKAKQFYNLNDIKLKNKVASTDLKWSKGIENKFYEVVSKTVDPSIVINALNDVADANNTTSNKIGPDKKTLFKALNKLEEINHFLNASTYSDPEFRKEILKKSTYCLFAGDLTTMKDLSSLMNQNIDALSIKEVLNKININHSRFNVVEDLNIFNLMHKKTELKKFSNPVTRFCGGVFSFGIAVALTNSDLFIKLAQGEANDKMESLQKGIAIAKPITTNFIQNHASLNNAVSHVTSAADKVQQFGMTLIQQIPTHYQDPKVWGTVIAIGLLLYPVAKAVPKFLVKTIDACSDQQVNMRSIKDFNNNDYLRFFIKKDLLDGIIKKKEYCLADSNCSNHIDLVAFAVNKLDNPILKVEDFKDATGQSIVAKLGLSANEIDRLNGLTLEEIHSISQVQNVDFRDSMLRNKFTSEELLLIKKIEAKQLVNGYAIPKGKYFEVANETDLDVNLRSFMFSGSPIKTAIIANVLKIGAKEDGEQIISNRDYINMVRNTNDANLYDKLNNGLKLDINDKDINKYLTERLKLEKYNNDETKEKLENVFSSYSVNINELKKILKGDDTVIDIVKNKALDVLTKIRNSFSSSTGPTP